jgi:hypothetical protein
VTLLVAGLHLRLLFHAGGLWRDEVNTLNVATMPSLAELWRGLEFESAPVFWLLLVRAWCALGLGDSDQGLRLLGLLTGLGVVASAWWVARRFDVGAPLCVLLLVALNPEVIRWGDSLRAFGMGSVLVLLAFEAIFRVGDAPTRGRVVWATLVTLMCVHSLYYNALFILAICLGSAMVNFRRRRFGRIGIVTLVGAIAAGSMLPYVATLQAQHLGTGGFQLAQLPVLVRTLSAQHAIVPWVWLVLVAMALAGGVLAWRRPDSMSLRQRDQCLFATTAGISAALLFIGFLVTLGYPTQAWYYIALLALLALALDVVLQPLLRGPRGRILTAGFAVLLLALSIPSAWRTTATRFTNVDVVGRTLARTAQAGDLIVVQPWYLGIPFQRYYASNVPWTLLPPIEDRRVHRWDLLAQHIAAAEPIRPILERAQATLERGDRVFIVRLFPVSRRNAPPVRVPPAPDGIREASLYDLAWVSQLDSLLERHAARFARAPLEPMGRVNEFESAWVRIAYGGLE